MSSQESIWAPTKRAARAAVAFVGHLFLSLVVVGGVYVMELSIRYIWGANEPLLFDRVPLKWLFQFIDVCILAVFGACGTMEAYRKLRE
jgi:hypothetical protein